MCLSVMSYYHFSLRTQRGRVCVGAMMGELWGGQVDNQSTAMTRLLIRRAVCSRRWTEIAGELRP